MRIVGGAWRGRRLVAPAGSTTRPTAERARQAIFDIVMHAPWGGRGLLEGAAVLDAFAGTGAMGLEALSRGAAHAAFIEHDRVALVALHANIAACKAAERTIVLATDALKPPPGTARTLVFLDPPYGLHAVQAVLPGLRLAGWIVPGTVVIAETKRLEFKAIYGVKLAQRVHGAAEMNVWREC